MDRVRRVANTTLRPLVMVACGYEFVALLPRSRRQSISMLCNRHRWLAPIIVGGLTLHLLDMGRHADEHVIGLRK